MANEYPDPMDEDDDFMNGDEAKENSRRDRPTGSTHFGDEHLDVVDDYGEATWEEVCKTCFVHSPSEWGMIAVGVFLICFFLYWFLFGLELLGTGAKVMCGCGAGQLFGEDTNPIAGLMVGIMATVLLQSSSTTTSIIVSLVGPVISVGQGIYMIMGANIGTSVTNTIVAMGQMGDGDQLERAFAGATVHDMFNFMTVAILLPVEVITGYLKVLTGAITRDAETREGENWEGPVNAMIGPVANRVIIANKDLIEKVAADEDASCEEGGGFYPIECYGEPSFESCSVVGLISCDENTGKCPAFFQENARASDDKVSGGVVFFISIIILFTCLLGLVAVLQKMLLGMSTRIVYKATDMNGYVAILLGAGITMIVQSSSITTSTLTPLVGMGALRLEQMLPLTLGANIGTTMTAIMASLVADTVVSIRVALAHLFFNITGILIFYPVPFMRSMPIYAAKKLGKATRIWKGFPLVYIVVMFLLVPMLFLGLSFLFQQGVAGYTVLGAFLTILLLVICLWTAHWCRYNDGVEKCTECMRQREQKRMLFEELPSDMQYLKNKVAALIEHTGLPDEDMAMDDDDRDDDEELEA